MSDSDPEATTRPRSKTEQAGDDAATQKIEQVVDET